MTNFELGKEKKRQQERLRLDKEKNFPLGTVEKVSNIRVRSLGSRGTLAELKCHFLPA